MQFLTLPRHALRKLDRKSKRLPRLYRRGGIARTKRTLTKVSYLSLKELLWKSVGAHRKDQTARFLLVVLRRGRKGIEDDLAVRCNRKLSPIGGNGEGLPRGQRIGKRNSGYSLSAFRLVNRDVQIVQVT